MELRVHRGQSQAGEPTPDATGTAGVACPSGARIADQAPQASPINLVA